jgi:hypothetical protein
VPLTAHSLDVFADDWLLALQALGSSSLSALCLALKTPSIPILLDMAHAFLERITTFSAEEVTKMPVLTQCNRMFTDNRCLAMLASGGEVLMPVKMTVVAQSLVAILSHSLAFNFRELLSSSSSLNSVDALRTMHLRFRADFESFKSSSAGEANETLRVEAFSGPTERYNSSFDG